MTDKGKITESCQYGNCFTFFCYFCGVKENMDTQLLTLSPHDIDRAIHVIDHGALWLCLEGEASLGIDLDKWHMSQDSVIVFFPGDVVQWHDMTDDFRVKVISYSSEILRSACLNIEHSIYSLLHDDRLCQRQDVVDHVVKNMFRILDFYFDDRRITDVDNIVNAQLRSFFMGYNSFVTNHSEGNVTQGASRTVMLFNRFMELVKTAYREAHEVAWFADRLHISRKYLGIIVKERTGFTPKKIIDEYVILQLQLTLRTTQKPMKMIASEFHFADVSVMTRYFKSHTGINPLKYRNG